MKFYHSTTSENAKSIVSSQEIKLSEYDIKEYIRETLSNGWFDKGGSKDDIYNIPNKYIDNDGNERHVYWLGKGIYCFVETDLEQAREYNANHDAVVEIHVDKAECKEENIFNMDSKSNRKILKSFIINGLSALVEMQETPKDKEHIKRIQKVLKTSLGNNFRGTPHIAGVLIDLYLSVHLNVKIVKCTFSHGGGKANKDPWFTNYVALKDKSIILSLNQI